jgi:creatine kinase
VVRNLLDALLYLSLVDKGMMVMDNDNISQTIREIRAQNPNSLMARYFDEGYYNSLDKAAQEHLNKIIMTGIVNPNSQMGAYAMEPQDYDLFSALLEPMIRDFHAIDAAEKFSQLHDWDTESKSCNLGVIDERLKDVSMRVRVARNVSTFPLPGAMTKDDRLNFESMMARAFSKLSKDPTFDGKYLSITPGSPYEISEEEYNERVAAHQMFKDMSSDPYLNAAGISSDWPYGRGIYISRTEDFLVWVGEEDHLRIMAMQVGGDLNALFERLRIGLMRIENMTPAFAKSKSFGNVTSCPTNLGTGMRASLHVKLPKLTNNGQDLNLLKHEAKALGLAVRGAGGEHSDAGQGGLVDISPTARLGVTEMEIMQSLYDGVAKLWAMEVSQV